MKDVTVIMLALCATGSVAFADEGTYGNQSRQQKRFAALDTDSDGVISKAEAEEAPRLTKNFDEMDKDSDGFLTLEEIKAGFSLLRKS
ncbi:MULTISPECIES: hypothetical protein [unclassified Oceanobacter]|uniref:hypothetical protein n=1 Tax=unclassified Oceanobacter TaxID=2620260 RepID=UPI00273393B4|nr:MULTISPECIES: hypothetical protein [unclassified Oceanobacter]MDP2607395.1 hypothetical protein [Oceanobacter sp. 1_MG-2023]MDP2610663.1 hypothetical protein [Oceanobacter sp. 2_MG-2023]